MDDLLKRLSAVIPHLATKADVSALETSIIKWFVGTVIASAALTFGIVKLLVP